MKKPDSAILILLVSWFMIGTVEAASCQNDLDPTSAILSQMAGLTLQWETARIAGDPIKFQPIDILYQAKRREMTAHLNTSDLDQLDQQIAYEITRLQTGRTEAIAQATAKQNESRNSEEYLTPWIRSSAFGGIPPSYTSRARTISPNGRLLYLPNPNREIEIWDTETKQRISQLTLVFPAPITRIEISPDGSRLYTANGTTNTTDIWELKKFNRFNQHLNHSFTHLSFGADGKSFYTADPSGRIRIIDAVTHKVRRTMGTKAKVEALLVSPDQKTLYVAHENKVVKISSLDAKIQTELLIENQVKALALSPNGAILALGKANGEVQLRLAAVPARIEKRLVFDFQIVSLTFSKTGRSLFIQTRGGMLHTLDIESGDVVDVQLVTPTRELNEDSYNGFDFSADLNTIYTVTPKHQAVTYQFGR